MANDELYAEAGAPVLNCLYITCRVRILHTGVSVEHPESVMRERTLNQVKQNHAVLAAGERDYKHVNTILIIVIRVPNTVKSPLLQLAHQFSVGCCHSTERHRL